MCVNRVLRVSSWREVVVDRWLQSPRKAEEPLLEKETEENERVYV